MAFIMTQKRIASIANELIFDARYKLEPRELKVLLHLISLLRPEDEHFGIMRIPIKDLEHLLNPERKKWGNAYKEINTFCLNLLDKKIVFPEQYGYKGGINWVAAAVPVLNEDNVICMQFEFARTMSPFLLQLQKNFTKIDPDEVVKMTSAYAIRLFEMLKAHQDREKSFKRYKRDNDGVVYYEYYKNLQELKAILGIPDKYPKHKDFNRRVIIPAQEQMEELSSLRFQYIPKKEGRKIVGCTFHVYENTPRTQVVRLSKKERQDKQMKLAIVDYQRTGLSPTQEKALEKLIDFGVNKSLAKELIYQHCATSEIKGREDQYVAFCLSKIEAARKRRIQEVQQGKHNKRVTPKERRGGLVKPAFEKNHYFSEFMEMLSATRNQRRTRPVSNRSTNQQQDHSAMKIGDILKNSPFNSENK